MKCLNILFICSKAEMEARRKKEEEERRKQEEADRKAAVCITLNLPVSTELKY